MGDCGGCLEKTDSKDKGNDPDLTVSSETVNDRRRNSQECKDHGNTSL